MRNTATPSQPIATVGGWPINLANLGDAVSHIIADAAQRQSFAVFTLNLDHLDKLRRCSPFSDAYLKARYVTADGAPVAMLASRQGVHVERTTGADLIVPLAQAAAANGLRVYLFGSTADVLERAGAELVKRAGGHLTIAGAASPEHFDPHNSAADDALDRIAASGAALCYLALGAPKQELFAARGIERGINVGFICIGAGLDFIAGTQRRAPVFMQRSGLEWLWRLVTNPRRLGLRYARCALVLAKLILLPSAAQTPAKRSDY